MYQIAIPAVQTAWITCGRSPRRISAGLSTKAKGRMNSTDPRRIARIPVLSPPLPAIPAATTAASATGGVM